jgi:hypothetical protein
MPPSRGQFKMVLDPASETALDTLARRLGLSRAAVMRLALRRLAQMEGVEVADAPETEGNAAA